MSRWRSGWSLVILACGLFLGCGKRASDAVATNPADREKNAFEVIDKNPNITAEEKERRKEFLRKRATADSAAGASAEEK